MGRSRFEEEEHEGGMERWLLTYADLITLLMAFFVIMYAMSNIDATKYSVMAKSLKIALGVEDKTGGGSGLIAGLTGDTPGNDSKVSLKGSSDSLSPSSKMDTLTHLKDAQEQREFTVMIKRIKEYTTTKGIVSNVTMTIDGRGLVINLSDRVLFETGKADLSPKAKEVLDGISAIILDSNKHIKIEGHTDNVPIHNERYPSNWQLSTDRATNVIMYWLEKHPGASSKLSAAGYGEHRPIDSNDTPEGRAKNRRVDIILLKDSLSAVEPTAKTQAPVDLGEDVPAKED